MPAPWAVESSAGYQTATPLVDQPSAPPQLALVQLLDHVRSALISLMSYELQTPLSTLQIAMETLAEGETIPAQVQRRMVKVAQVELKRLCYAVDIFLSYANRIWRITLEFLQSQASPIDAAERIFAALPQELEHYRSWIEPPQAKLTNFMQGMEQQNHVPVHPLTPQQISLLEQRQRQILAIVNHELSTPLATLQVCLDTLQEDEQPHLETQQSILSVACDDLQRLCMVVHDLELLRRLEIGHVCFRHELIDLKATLQSTLNSFLKQTPKTMLSKISIEPIGETTGCLSLLWADGDRLVDVVTRLLENACRFTASTGEVRVSITCLDNIASTDHHSTLQICIADTGCGIRSEQLDHVFDCFHQEEGYLQRTIGGIGIGLTICRYLVEGMGGKIWAESAGKHQGSQFCFTLPVQREGLPLGNC